ncbi:M3 family oligoendopeptidase [Streptococcus moroccensis]|uniref:M3 family oligoendopeptidase n=1 Tax=Streptococcus moroccensis TaxID=1451356 RepID=A0ABT9YPS5_9STRE|nr:M3 family oligoendopeptidase [Streptococcus moroccensis]MDQ0221601.1 M3 family oligoendopeptidase [Streptococcus moroccensis]
MKFSDYTYTRPDFDSVKADYTRLTDRLATAATADEAKAVVSEVNKLSASVDTQMTLCSIRHSIDTTDSFYEAETDYWNEHGPLYQELATNYYKALVDSPFRTELAEILPETFFKSAENQLKIFSPEIIPLLQKENDLVNQYEKLIASAEIPFQDGVYNLTQMGPFAQSTDRATRKAASETTTGFFVENEHQFDSIYDQLVKTRDQIAKTLGFKDYVEYGYYNMNRFDYNRDMVKTYREEIKKHVVPLVESLYQRQAERIQVPSLKHYDAALEFLDGNAVPQGDPDFIINHGIKMYHELSPETGEFIDFMVEHDLLDLVAKKGKRAGGYCTYLPDFKSPFIFSNFNGTSADIDVLTHEAGHAFQVYQSRWIENPESIWPTYETCEIHSMSMEFITWPWMDGFFGPQVDKYKFSHLAGTLYFLPYGVLVDHYQHEVYENPDMTPAERKATWRRLEKEYLPYKDYSESADLDRGIFWFRQGHIYASPFYYIDYTLAQVCALQFWKRTQVDHDETAWSDYLAICQAGGTKSFLQMVALANLNSPFKEGALESTVQAASDYLNSIDDKAL